jgi:hypothetical protein
MIVTLFRTKDGSTFQDTVCPKGVGQARTKMRQEVNAMLRRGGELIGVDDTSAEAFSVVNRARFRWWIDVRE